MKKALFVTCLAVMVIFMATTTVQAADNNVVPGLFSTQGADIVLPDDTGWLQTWSGTSDCVDGWGDDIWTITLTRPYDLTVRVEDCCVIGDYYAIYVGDCVIGTTPIPDPLGPLSDGSAIVSLGPGTYLIKIKNILPTWPLPTGCPAGYWVTGTLGDYTGDYPPCTIEVDVDIKGGSCPNPFNPKSKGSVPVAILGSVEFLDTIDPTTITLMGVPALDEGVYEDSTQPGEYTADCYDCFDADDPDNFNCDYDPVAEEFTAYCGDGIPELVVKFDTQELATAIAAAGGAVKGACLELLLEGTLYDGVTPIEGSDSVVVLKAIAAE